MPGEDTKLLEQIARSLDAMAKAQTRGKGSISSASTAAGRADTETSLLVRSQRRLQNVMTGRALGGGVPGLLAAGAAGAGIAGAVGAGAAGARGITSAALGGSAQAGFTRGAVDITSNFGGLSSIVGTAQASRITGSVQERLQRLVTPLARAGILSPADSGALTNIARVYAAQETRVERSRELVGNIADRVGARVAESEIGKFEERLKRIGDLLGGLGDILERLVGRRGG